MVSFRDFVADKTIRVEAGESYATETRGQVARALAGAQAESPSLAIGLIAAAIGTATFATDAFEDTELDSVDARFSIRGERAAETGRGGRDRRRHLQRARESSGRSRARCTAR